MKWIGVVHILGKASGGDERFSPSVTSMVKNYEKSRKSIKWGGGGVKIAGKLRHVIYGRLHLYKEKFLAWYLFSSWKVLLLKKRFINYGMENVFRASLWLYEKLFLWKWIWNELLSKAFFPKPPIFFFHYMQNEARKIKEKIFRNLYLFSVSIWF